MKDICDRSSSSRLVEEYGLCEDGKDSNRGEIGSRKESGTHTGDSVMPTHSPHISIDAEAAWFLFEG